jgi:hypothetical protein
VLYHMSHIPCPSPFCFVIFQIGHPISVWTSLWSSYLHLLWSWDDRCMHHTLLVFWDGVFLIFCQTLSWTAVLLISASQLTGIIGMNHYAWPPAALLLRPSS